jgi:hypothetical protein
VTDGLAGDFGSDAGGASFDLAGFLKGLATPRGNARSLVVPAAAAGALGLIVFFADQALFAWCRSVAEAHSSALYSPFRVAADILHLGDANDWVPYFGIAAAGTLVLTAIFSLGFAQATFAQTVLSGIAIAAGGISALQFLTALVLLIVCGILFLAIALVVGLFTLWFVCLVIGEMFK